MGPTKTKQLIFFAILLMVEFILNILCDVIHDVFIKHVYDTVRKKTFDLLRTHVPAFIEPENWPPDSPDLNPVDYSIWAALHQLFTDSKFETGAAIALCAISARSKPV